VILAQETLITNQMDAEPTANFIDVVTGSLILAKFVMMVS
jgi:hypothetical protein